MSSKLWGVRAKENHKQTYVKGKKTKEHLHIERSHKQVCDGHQYSLVFYNIEEENRMYMLSNLEDVQNELHSFPKMLHPCDIPVETLYKS